MMRINNNYWSKTYLVKSIILFALLWVSDGSKPCIIGNISSSGIENAMMLCIAECLELTEDSAPCFYNYKTGAVVNDILCPKKYVRSTEKDKKTILCDYVHEPGANISASSMLVCDIINFKKITVFDRPKETLKVSSVYLEQILRIKSDASLAGIKTTFQVGAFSDSEGMDPESISIVAGIPEKRSKLLSNILEISKKYEFDGVTFAWLFPGCPQGKCNTIKVRDKAKMVPFFSELSKVMKSEGKISALFSLCNDPAVNWYLGDIYSNITEFVDYFIMECDMQNWLSNPRITLPSSLQVAQENVRMLMEKTTGVHSQLLLSLTPSSLNFRLRAGNGNTLGSMPSYLDQSLPYYKLCKWMRNDNITRVKNISTQNYAYSSTNLLAYDDYESLKAKVDELILANDLAGVHVKIINWDDLSGVCGCGDAPYTRMIAELLKGGEDCKPNRCI